MNTPLTNFFSTNEGAYVFYTYTISENKGSIYKVLCLVNKHTYNFLKTFIPDPYKKYGNTLTYILDVCVGWDNIPRDAILPLFKTKCIPFRYIIDKFPKIGCECWGVLTDTRFDFPEEIIRLNMPDFGECEVSIKKSPDITLESFLELSKNVSFTPCVYANEMITTPQSYEIVRKCMGKTSDGVLFQFLRGNKSFRPRDFVDVFSKKLHKQSWCIIFDHFLHKNQRHTLSENEWEYILSNFNGYYKFCRGNHNIPLVELVRLIGRSKISIMTLSNERLFNEHTITDEVLQALIGEDIYNILYFVNVSKSFLLAHNSFEVWKPTTIAKCYKFENIGEYISFCKEVGIILSTSEFMCAYLKYLTIPDIEILSKLGVGVDDLYQCVLWG